MIFTTLLFPINVISPISLLAFLKGRKLFLLFQLTLTLLIRAEQLLRTLHIVVSPVTMTRLRWCHTESPHSICPPGRTEERTECQTASRLLSLAHYSIQCMSFDVLFDTKQNKNNEHHKPSFFFRLLLTNKEDFIFYISHIVLIQFIF